ncbi:hypothetical protein [Nostoc parmelioides]|uniref:Uncharacterized protein n=1 Tax=Nostoc parmelioides FACHB-3921 TaxID=2692909 RepID=A0ABR8BKV9_9NOSO|nr:hypothetical protein [Nostoc parmelioides]MBD2254728.1 hypothetical protein [Nostoc parmelioides FACHB-3921]
MRQQANNVELPKVKRVKNSWDGKVINYLLNHPSKRSSPELILEALSSYWLVEALEGKVSDEEFRKACCAAAENLLKKLASIQRMSGLNFNTMTSVPSLELPVETTTQSMRSQVFQQQENEDDEEDDWNLNLQPTQEMLAANQILEQQ